MTDYTDRRYIPEGAALVDSQGTDTAIYTYESNGTPMAIAYHGKAGKHDWHYRFKSTEERAARIAKTIAHWRAIAANRAERRAAQRAPHTAETGDIFYASWGYDQTNIDFYQVTALAGKSMVELRELAQEKEETGFMSGTCQPVKDSFTGEPIRRKCSGENNSIRVSSCQYASPWDGNPKHWSSYA